MKRPYLKQYQRELIRLDTLEGHYIMINFRCKQLEKSFVQSKIFKPFDYIISRILKQDEMKRYLVFYGSVYYPCGGMEDFLSDHDTQEEALKAITDKIETDIDGRDYSWAHIYDTEKRVEVWSK